MKSNNTTFIVSGAISMVVGGAIRVYIFLMSLGGALPFSAPPSATPAPDSTKNAVLMIAAILFFLGAILLVTGIVRATKNAPNDKAPFPPKQN